MHKMTPIQSVCKRMGTSKKKEKIFVAQTFFEKRPHAHSHLANKSALAKNRKYGWRDFPR